MTLRDEIRNRLRPRPRSSHKGNYGRVFILAGSKGLAGAAHLAAMGALRMGAGLVTLGVPEKVYAVLARRESEVMVRPFPSTSAGTLAPASVKPILDFLKTQDVLALGPGLSGHPGTQQAIRRILKESFPKPLIVDADALNALRGHAEVFKSLRGRAVLTPHPGEFRRIFPGSLRASDAARKNRASEAARNRGVVIVLKGFHTVAADPSGRVSINPTGNPGMATGGSGDVLTGVIAALAGQGFSLWDAARFGVYLHGLAGDLAARQKGEISLTAGDLLDFLPRAILDTLAKKRRRSR